MAEIQTAFDLDDDPTGGAREQQTAALLTQLQINPQQANEQQAAHPQADEPDEPDDPHRGRHHGARRVLDINLIYMEPQVEGVCARA